VALGVALGVAQIGWEFARKKPTDTMQWMSLFLVVGSGAATLITADPRFVMVKPSLIYIVVGVVMLKSGWMSRYLPSLAMEVVPDLAFIFGFIWSGLMFFSAVLNLIVALNFSVAAWASFMSVYGIVSKLGLFLIQYAIMRYIGVRRRRAMPNLLEASLRTLELPSELPAHIRITRRPSSQPTTASAHRGPPKRQRSSAPIVRHSLGQSVEGAAARSGG
jgi:intracellular septation protein